jgi:predicted TIM-barrel fold metal-dependent hydrolase
MLERCAVKVVIDHMGLPDVAHGIAQPGFEAVASAAIRATRLGQAGRRRSHHPRERRLARCDSVHAGARCRCAAARGVGSDWPHIGFHSGRQVSGESVLPYRKLDVGELLEVLNEAVPDEQARRLILVDNPATLYGFDLNPPGRRRS